MAAKGGLFSALAKKISSTLSPTPSGVPAVPGSPAPHGSAAAPRVPIKAAPVRAKRSPVPGKIKVRTRGRSSSNPATPAGRRQVRGAQYPPRYAPPDATGAVAEAGTGKVSGAGGPGAGSGHGEPSTTAGAGTADSAEAAAVSGGTPAEAGDASPVGFDTEGFSKSKLNRFAKVLEADNVDMKALKSLCWNGLPSTLRPDAWRLLLGVLPTNRARRAAVISRKRAEYMGFVRQYFGDAVYRTDTDKKTLRDILVDCPRTCPEIPLFHTEFVQSSLERVLYIWAMRHPASGYVQGINDIVTPFYTVLFGELGFTPASAEIVGVAEDRLMALEADVYCCLTKLLDGYQDHYTFSQPGIQRMVFKLTELIHKLDEKLAKHVESQGVQWMTLVFRWMNCLLLRELPLNLVLRLWDSLLCEDGGFETFHVYVCASIVLKFSSKLVSLPGHDIHMFMQTVPTQLVEWSVRDIEELVSQAYVNKTLYEASPKHLQ